MNKKISPSTAVTVASRVYDIKESYDFNGEFHNDFVRNFKITNNQIKGVSSGLINQLLNLAAQITGSLKG